MDPNPKSFPILSYVLNRFPSIGPKHSDAENPEIDIEQPPPRPPGSAEPGPSTTVEIVEQMPYLTRPKVISSMTRAISDVSQTRSILRTLGPRPDHESVDAAKAKVAEIEGSLSKKLEEIVISTRPSEVDRLQFRSHLAEKENECRKWAQKEKAPYRAIVQLDEMHESYEKLLMDAEKRLEKIYESAEASEAAAPGQWEDVPVNDEVNEKVVEVLKEASGKGMEEVDLSGRKLRFLPEAFGQMNGLVLLNVSNNQLEVLPDSIAGLKNLVELNVSSNLLESLPDSIGLLEKMKILNVSGNKLTTLPDPLCQCRSLVELDASFNKLAYLPTNIGYGLVNLESLVIQLNKIRSLPSSVGEMKSLRHLDAHFNELRVLPVTVGKLTNLETLNLSSNFSDLEELPDTIGDLVNLRELDLSNNQIRALPVTFGRLDKLAKLNLEHNPLEMPPAEIVKFGVEAVKVFMAKRWLDILLEEELKSRSLEGDEETEAGWLTRGTSWFSNVASGVSGYLGTTANSPRDQYLNQQL